MSDICTITITGNLTGDPEQKSTTSGKSVVEFSVAVGRYDRRERAERPVFFRVSVWSESEQAWIMNKAQRGTAVTVVGEYDQAPRQGEGVFNNISRASVKLTARTKGGGGYGQQRQVAGAPTTSANPQPFDNDDDIPF
jgi:single-stranded DNA-binding protein